MAQWYGLTQEEVLKRLGTNRTGLNEKEAERRLETYGENVLKEQEEMRECMPHYYKVTNHHGQGAETIMRAEAAFVQGRFTDAHIALESAYAQIRDLTLANGEKLPTLDAYLEQGAKDASMKLICEMPHRSMSPTRHSVWLSLRSTWYSLLTASVSSITRMSYRHRKSESSA